MAVPGTGKAPSVYIIIPHFIFGALSFIATSILLLFSTSAFNGHYFHPQLLSIVHLTVLGWGVMIIFGSIYQLLPVLLETNLYSEKLAVITFLFFSSGVILLVWSFWNFAVGLPLELAALFVLLAFFLFAVNVFMTVNKSTRVSIERDFISTSVFWLLFTGILGLLMAINFTHPFIEKSHLVFLKIHAHLGIIGWFLLLIMGVASKLIPMFLLAQKLNQKKLSLAYYFVNAGLIGFMIDLYGFEGSRFLPISVVLIVIGLFSFISYIFEAYQKRLRRVLDIGLKHTFAAMLFILLPAILGVIISFSNGQETGFLLRLYLVYGTSIFLGFISALILGQTFKTLPFLIWLHRYGKSAGTDKSPLPKDLYSEKLAESQFIIYLTAIALLLSGIFVSNHLLISSGAGLLLTTAIIYNLNVIRIIFVKPNLSKQ